MTLEEIRTNVKRRTGWANLQLVHDKEKRQVKWFDDKDYSRSVCIVGLEGRRAYEVYGRPFQFLTQKERQFIESALNAG